MRGRPWIIDSGASNHMTGSQIHLTSIQSSATGGTVSFGNKGKGKIKGTGTAILNPSIKATKVSLVEGLGFNLLSVSQMCDQGENLVTFDSKECLVINKKSNKVVLKGVRQNNVYIFNQEFKPKSELCLSASKKDADLWHCRLGHAGPSTILKLHQKNLVKGLPRIDPETVEQCEACIKGKQTRTSFKSKNEVSTKKPLELLHMDLCGPMRTLSHGGKR